MKKQSVVNVLYLFLILLTFNLHNVSFAQEKEDEETPKEQIPLEERKTGDSFIENVGELPGDLVTFPVRLVLKGISKTARWIDFQNVYLRVTDWLTNEDGTRKVRPIFMPASGGGLIFIQDNLFREGMKFRASGSSGTRTRRNFYGGLRDTQLFSSKFGLELAGFYKRLPDEDFFGLGNDSRKTFPDSGFAFSRIIAESEKILIGLPSVKTSQLQSKLGRK